MLVRGKARWIRHGDCDEESDLACKSVLDLDSLLAHSNKIRLLHHCYYETQIRCHHKRLTISNKIVMAIYKIM
jgi:hypothetical protein